MLSLSLEFVTLKYRFAKNALFFTPRTLRSYRSERGVYDISVRSMNIDDQRLTDLRAYLAHILENCKWPYLSDASSDRLRVWFYGGV